MKMIILLSLIANTSVFASGIITLNGKFFGKTDKDFQIESRDEVFTLDGARLSEGTRKYLQKLKWHQPVTVSVNMQSITDVKTLKTK